jgi:hypothetical protein
MSSQIANNALYLTESTADFGCRHVVRDSTGKRYAIHINDSGDLEVKSSTDGTTWSADTSYTPTSGTLRYPTLCIGKDDDLYVAYREGNLSSYTIKVKQRAHSGGAWTEILSWNITIYGTTTGAAPGITASQLLSDRIHVFVAYQDSATSHIVKNQYTDNKGSAWTAGADLTWAISTGDKDCYIWDIDTYHNGNIALIMRSNYTTYKCIFDVTGSSGVKTSLTTVAPDGGSLVIDYDDNLRWIALDYSTAIYTWDGTWIGDAIRRGSVSMGIDGDGNVYVFYTKTSDDKTYYYKWTRSTVTWDVSATLLSSNKGDRVKCEQRALSTSTKLCVVYFSDI